MIGPCVLPIYKRELNETQILNCIIEGLRFRAAKVIIILLMRIADHVEVSTNKPRGVICRSYQLEFIKESRAEVRQGGSIDVSDTKRKVGGLFRQVDSECGPGGGGVGAVEKSIIPRSEQTPSDARGGDRVISMKIAGEEGKKLCISNLRELCFLKKDDLG
jgi:hypothetical protein